MTIRRGVACSLTCLLGLTAGCVAEQPSGASELDRADDAAAALPSALPLDSALALAEATYQSLDYVAAREMFRSLLGRARVAEDAPAEAKALTALGIVEWNLAQDYREARRLLLESLDFKREHSLTDQLFSSHNALGLLSWSQNRLPEAATRLEEAIRLGEDGGEIGRVATARMNLALVQAEWGDFRAAREGFIAMRDTMEVFGEHFEPPDRAFRLGAALTNLGMLDVRVGNPRGAVEWLLEATEVFREGNPAGVGLPMGHLAIAYSMLGEQTRAFAVLDTALLQVRAQGLRQEEASNLEVLAEQYREAGDFSRALALYDKAKEINAELGLTVETGADLRGEAEIHLAWGAAERALAPAEEALTLHTQAGVALEAFYDRLVLAEARDRLGHTEEASEQLEAARELGSQLNVRSARVTLALGEARFAERRLDAEAVLEALRAAEQDLVRGGYAEQWQGHLLASRAHAALGRPDSAVAAGWRALETVERVRGSYASGALRTTFASDKREVYTHLVSVLVDVGRYHEAFAVSDAARGRALVEGTLSARGLGSEVGARSELRLREIDTVLQSIDLIETGENSVDPETDVAALDELYGRLEDLRAAYESALLRGGTDGQATDPVGLQRNSLRDVQSALAPDELLIEYFVPGSGAVRIFVVSRESVSVLEAPLSARNLASRVRVARDLMARSGEAAVAHAVLEGLHAALIGPVSEAGLLDGVRRLVVVPHDVLAYLPSAALRDPDSRRFVMEDYEVRVLPSASALTRISGDTEDAVEAWRGGAVFAPLPQELPASRGEAEAVAEALSGARRLVGASATELELRTALASASPVHVATHGILNTLSPMFSRVLLAPGTSGSGNDGRLEVHELLGLQARAPLVFLSGCETGVGRAGATRFSRGEDYTTLAQAFLMSGVDHVIATLWRVDDEASALFAQSFYEALRTEPPAAALASAQRELRGVAEYSAPYYWAGYQLLGAGTRTRAAQ